MLDNYFTPGLLKKLEIFNFRRKKKEILKNFPKNKSKNIFNLIGRGVSSHKLHTIIEHYF